MCEREKERKNERETFCFTVIYNWHVAKPSSSFLMLCARFRIMSIAVSAESRIYARMKEISVSCAVTSDVWMSNEGENETRGERKRDRVIENERKRDWMWKIGRIRYGWTLVRSCCASIRVICCSCMSRDVVYVTFPRTYVCCSVGSLKLIFCWYKWFSCTEVLVRP